VSLSAGTKLGPYEIVAPIGAGGMGEVYKARDTRLERTVAIKVLPGNLSSSPEVRQRFEREAKTISQLSHPHICALYDVGRDGDTDYLVMEYLEGETLSERLSKGALSLEQTLRYGIEIAEALDTAHRQGIVHRDLKPGNVMLTKSGVKLLDFGLAKAFAPVTQASSLTALPTAMGSPNLTQEGTILGTFQYMAPEQLEGKEADPRTDIFAFGAVLYEMATGQKPFGGKSQASLIAAILEREPPAISTVQPMTPPALDRVVKTCLAKDPEDRWQSAGDLKRELRWIGEGSSQAAAALVPSVSRRVRRDRVWMAAAVFSFAALVAALLFWRADSRRPRRESRPVRFEMAPPEKGFFEDFPAVSPDGRFVACVVTSGESRLWVRSLDSVSGRELPGTENGSNPFWSPDGRSLGFFSDGKLKRVELSGGAPQTLCEARLSRGGTWGRDGVILFAPDGGASLHRVPASGGEPIAVFKLEAARMVNYKWPRFLPDGRRFLFLLEGSSREAGVHVGSLDSTKTTRLLETGVAAAYVPPGLLLFVRGETLLAQPFDAKEGTLSGEAMPVAEGIGTDEFLNVGYFSASENGVLTFRTGSGLDNQLAWFDRQGKRLGTVGPPGRYDHPELSPDGKRIVLDRAETSGRDLWVVELSRGTATRLTFHPSNDWTPAWSPDGSRVAFVSFRDGPPNLYQKNANGVGEEEPLLKGSLRKHHLAASADGRFFAFEATSAETKSDVWVMPLFGDRKPFPFVQTPFAETHPRFSPDGRAIAYSSEESGRREVYVQSFPSGGGKWQISTNGGSDPRWRGDGREIFYAFQGKIMAVPLSGGASFEAGVPVALFDATRRSHGYAPDASGQRFFILAPVGETAPSPLTVVLDWTAGLKK